MMWDCLRGLVIEWMHANIMMPCGVRWPGAATGQQHASKMKLILFDSNAGCQSHISASRSSVSALGGPVMMRAAVTPAPWAPAGAEQEKEKEKSLARQVKSATPQLSSHQYTEMRWDMPGVDVSIFIRGKQYRGPAPLSWNHNANPTL